MTNKTRGSITIIGCGLAGSFLALLLARKGYKITVYERLSRRDVSDIASKRSYNIVLFGYGSAILKKVELWKFIQPHILKLKGTVTHIGKNYKPTMSVSGKKSVPYYTISRAKLVNILLKQASEYASVSIHYNTTLLAINRREKTIVMQNTKTGKIETVTCEVVIGADGVNSLVRPFLQQGQETTNLQEYAQWQYRQFTLSQEKIDELHLKRGFVHTWTQKNAFITLHPDANNALSALFVYPKDNASHISLNSSEAIAAYFTKNFPELVPALDEITPSLLSNPDGAFVTIHTDPWYYKDFLAIMGDAAHGFYPFFGQGTSAAFGDAMELARLLDKYGPAWEKIFPLYQAARKPHMDALGELSKEVLLKYLRCKKGDYNAMYDRLEMMLHRLIPYIIYPPLSQAVLKDPGHAEEHRQNSLKQQRLAKRLGVTLLITVLAATIASYEKCIKKLRKVEKDP